MPWLADLNRSKSEGEALATPSGLSREGHPREAEEGAEEGPGARVRPASPDRPRREADDAGHSTDPAGRNRECQPGS